jgi:NAD(P)-dependent dehydrogenase (short-subunit alcohol dehydrogenase family)
VDYSEIRRANVALLLYLTVVASRFEDKVILVTGAGTGIGRAVACGFAREGARVALVGRRAEALEETAREIGDRKRALCLPCDISQPGEPGRIVSRVAQAFGTLNVLVNNAATFFRKRLAETSDEDLSVAYRTNVIAPLALAREALPHLRSATPSCEGGSGGCIINVSSTAANIAKPTLAAYSSSKLALEQATRTLAVELGPEGIRVNCVAPGMTSTDMIADLRADPDRLAAYVGSTPLGRVGEPGEVALAVLFLASDDARWITGQIVQVSGGFQL